MKIPFQMCQLTVICANISDLLINLNLLGIGLHHVCRIDELTASFCIRQSQNKIAIQIIEQAGGKIVSSVPASEGLLLRGILQRPILMIGGALLLFLTIFLPTRVLFITVSGNEYIPHRQILDVAADCGVRFGVARHELRNEKVKNQLLAALPELKWVGVNTSGCVAQISVRERAVTNNEVDIPIVSSIVASCDGVIREMTVRSGNPICHVGEAVKKGQLLVSGYSDCGRCIYATRADGEIYAQTRRVLSSKALSNGIKKGRQTGHKKKIGLIIGKKRINFYKGSGISDTTCVRMYMEYPLILPGGFQLPVSLAVQEEFDYALTSMRADLQEMETLLKRSAQEYLERQMIAGRVGTGRYEITELDGALYMVGQYICDEMIGQTRSEESLNNYEQTD